MSEKTKKLNDLLNEIEGMNGKKPMVIHPDDMEPGEVLLIDEENDISVVCGLNAFFEETYDDLTDALIGMIIELMVKCYRKGLEENLDDIKKKLKEAIGEELGKLNF